jgi:hypothetical protein
MVRKNSPLIRPHIRHQPANRQGDRPHGANRADRHRGRGHRRGKPSGRDLRSRALQRTAQLSNGANGGFGSRLCENAARYNRTRNFEAWGHAQSKKMQKFVLRSALRPNQISFSHSLGQGETVQHVRSDGSFPWKRSSRPFPLAAHCDTLELAITRSQMLLEDQPASR